MMVLLMTLVFCSTSFSHAMDLDCGDMPTSSAVTVPVLELTGVQVRLFKEVSAESRA